jgi:nitroreductase
MIDSSAPLGTIDAINQRTSVRAYSPDKIDRSTIKMLLAAAVRAPTAIHEEPWAFSIIQDVDSLKRLSDLAKPIFLSEMQRAHLDRGGHTLSHFASPEFNIFYNAGTLVVICGKSTARFATPDCWLAAENMMLAACAVGLGTCVIGSAVSALNNPELKAEFGIPRNMTAIAPIIVGRPEAPAKPSARKAPQILSWKSGDN